MTSRQALRNIGRNVTKTHTTYCILVEGVKFFKTNKCEPHLRQSGCLVTLTESQRSSARYFRDKDAYLLYLGIPFKGQLIIIRHIAEFFLGKVYARFRYVIDLAFF